MAENNTKKKEIAVLCRLAETHLGYCEDIQGQAHNETGRMSQRVNRLISAIRYLKEALELLGDSPFSAAAGPPKESGK